MEKLVYYFICFFVFSVVGYICEVTYVYICNKKLVNRGFLHGPYIPIYGNGAIFITLALGQCKNVILVFLGSMLICSILEYVTSYVMEVIFHNRWWDYSKQKFNINGRVCLKNALLFGIGAIAIVYLLNPIFNKFYYMIDFKILKYICLGLMFIMGLDFVISFSEAIKLSTMMDCYNKFVNECANIKNVKFDKFKTRLFNAYPNLIFTNKKFGSFLKKNLGKFKKKINW